MLYFLSIFIKDAMMHKKGKVEILFTFVRSQFWGCYTLLPQCASSPPFPQPASQATMAPAAKHYRSAKRKKSVTAQNL